MTMPRISMDLQKEIQFLKPLLKSQRKIAKHLGINREAVAKYWNQTIPDTIPSVVPPDWTTKIDWEYVQKEIKCGVSAQTLYKEFSRVEQLPSYQNFARYFRLHKKPEKNQEVSLPIERIPGQTMVNHHNPTFNFVNFDFLQMSGHIRLFILAFCIVSVNILYNENSGPN